MLKVGDKCAVALGKYRGKGVYETITYARGYLPEGMLKDGAVVTIRKLKSDGWCYLEECRDYTYPLHLLKPTPIKQLLKHVRSLDEHLNGT